VPAMTAEEVVRQSLRALASDRAVCVNGLKNTIIAESTRLLPKPWLARLARRLVTAKVAKDRS